MEALIIVLLVVLVALAVAAVFVLAQRRRPQETEGQRLEHQLSAMKGDLTQAISSTQQAMLTQVNHVDVKLNQRLDAMQGNIDRSLTSTSQTIGKIGEQLGELGQSTQQMLEVGRDISSLQDILRPPKLRGGFGEMLLENLLGQILPAQHYTMQHRFRSGATVDAAIHLADSLVSVDSKFPLEAFDRMLKAEHDEERAAQRRDFVRAVRGHIDAVAKYILPDEGSLPFAFMYIPAENVYYEIIVKDDLLDGRGNLSTYALEQRVIPVSPNSFYAYLQAIVLGLRGMRVEERAQEIIRHLQQLDGDFTDFREDFELVGKHLKNASDRYVEVDRAITKFGDRLAMSLGEPVQPPLPEPSDVPAQATLPKPATVNGSDEPD